MPTELDFTQAQRLAQEADEADEADEAEDVHEAKEEAEEDASEVRALAATRVQTAARGRLARRESEDRKQMQLSCAACGCAYVARGEGARRRLCVRACG